MNKKWSHKELSFFFFLFMWFLMYQSKKKCNNVSCCSFNGVLGLLHSAIKLFILFHPFSRKKEQQQWKFIHLALLLVLILRNGNFPATKWLHLLNYLVMNFLHLTWMYFLDGWAKCLTLNNFLHSCSRMTLERMQLYSFFSHMIGFSMKVHHLFVDLCLQWYLRGMLEESFMEDLKLQERSKISTTLCPLSFSYKHLWRWLLDFYSNAIIKLTKIQCG